MTSLSRRSQIKIPDALGPLGHPGLEHPHHHSEEDQRLQLFFKVLNFSSPSLSLSSKFFSTPFHHVHCRGALGLRLANVEEQAATQVIQVPGESDDGCA